MTSPAADVPRVPFQKARGCLIASLQIELSEAGYEVCDAADATTAMRLFDAQPFDLVVSDVRMSGPSGLDLLGYIKQRQPETVVILMTAHGTVENAIDALRLGAFDYLTKPFELKELLITVERGIERRSVERENRKLRFLVSRKLGHEDEEEGGLAHARREWEKAYLGDLLKRTRGNVTRAAEMAGISRPNLHKKLKQLGINAVDFKGRNVS